MTPLTLPQARVPLAWVMVPDPTGGPPRRTPAEIDPEWMLGLSQLVSRSGGVMGREDLGQDVFAGEAGSLQEAIEAAIALDTTWQGLSLTQPEWTAILQPSDLPQILLPDVVQPASVADAQSAATYAAATTIGVGGATPSASGAGISFPATESASSDQNTLDDYEENTWTPAFTSLTVVNGTGGASYSGSYTKVGRLVKWSALVTVTGTATTASVAGTTYINNLPFTVVTYDTCAAILADMSQSGVGLIDTTGKALTPTWTAANKNVLISGTYETTT